MTTFDTLTYSKKLKEAGFSERQAEAQAEALRAVVEENLATKRDIELVRGDVKEVESRLSHEIELVRRDMREMENRITIRLGSLIVAAAVALGVLMKLL